MAMTKGMWCAAAVIGALSVGGYFGREYQKRMPKALMPNGAILRSEELATLRAENQRLHSELAARGKLAPETAGGPEAKARTSTPSLHQLNVLANLQKRRMATLNLDYVDRQGKLTAAFAGLFALTATEQEALQESVDRARERLAALERENANVTRDANGAVVISVRPFPEAGGAAYDQLVKSFADRLGPERHAAFLTLGVQQVERSLAHFGAAERSITISETAASNGNAGYRVFENQKQGSGHSTSTSQFRSYQEAITYLGTLERLLPPDFRSLPADSKIGDR